jgi:hypothetical protein
MTRTINWKVAIILIGVSLPVFCMSQKDYQELVALHQELLELRRPELVDGVPDYSAESMKKQKEGLEALRRRWASIATAAWSTSQKVDYLVVCAQLNQLDFDHRVVRSWSRDPGFYLDRVKRIPHMDVPIPANDIEAFQKRLQTVPRILEQAQANLTGTPAVLARLAIGHLEHYDGIGQGEPFRDVPPEGTIGWYRDLIERLTQHHPDLLDDAKKALAAAEGYRDWLAQNLGAMTEPAWIGHDHFNWFLEHVAFMPYTVDDLRVLGERELDRWRTFLAIEKNKNDHRGVPPLQLAASKEEYDQRVREAERQIRALMKQQKLLTIPADTPTEFETDAFWMERPGGKRHFWEELQYRNPLDNHIHASIPGHRFDGFMRKYVKNPIRAASRDGGRSEGWATYIEEMFLQAGLMDDIPRARELFLIALMKRAARVHVELEMQNGNYTMEEANRYLIDNVPFMEASLGRYDLEGYLRRPAYGSAYLIGKIQLEKLISDRAKQLGDEFDLGAFHDELLAAGTIPLSLIRWEMTGLDDGVKEIWEEEVH